MVAFSCFTILFLPAEVWLHPLRIEAGLGKAVSIEEIEIKWPNENTLLKSSATHP